MSEDITQVTMSDRAVFAGGQREVLVTSDHLNWYSWFCPLEQVSGLHVDDGLLAVIGDGQLAVSEVSHKGTLWHIVGLADKPTCIHIAVGCRIFVGTHYGRLFEFTVRRHRGILERLGLSKTAPRIIDAKEMPVPIPGEIDHIDLGNCNDG